MMGNDEEESQLTAEEGITVSNKFFLFLILGFAFVIVGVIIILFAAGGSGNFGAVIFIGPIPIVIGAGTDATLIILLSIILAVLSVVVFVVMKRRIRKFGC